jgi:hypothetical protein
MRRLTNVAGRESVVRGGFARLPARAIDIGDCGDRPGAVEGHPWTPPACTMGTVNFYSNRAALLRDQTITL